MTGQIYLELSGKTNYVIDTLKTIKNYSSLAKDNVAPIANFSSQINTFVTNYSQSINSTAV